VSEEILSVDQKSAARLRTRLKIGTWNIWWRYGPWQAREEALLAVLRAEDLDVLCLQEVWQDETEDQAARFGRSLGLHAAYGATTRSHGLGFGNAVLSRWSIAESEAVILPNSPSDNEDGGTRQALRAQIEGPRGPLTVISTHLCWRLFESAWRQAQVRALCELVACQSAPDFPPLVCGDFNAGPTSDEIRMMTGEAAVPVEGLVFNDAWAVAGDGGPGHTWHNTNSFAVGALEPNRRLDYIFVGEARANGAGHVTDCRIIGDGPVGAVFPSDHFGLVAEVLY